MEVKYEKQGNFRGKKSRYTDSIQKTPVFSKQIRSRYHQLSFRNGNYQIVLPVPDLLFKIIIIIIIIIIMIIIIMTVSLV